MNLLNLLGTPFGVGGRKSFLEAEVENYAATIQSLGSSISEPQLLAVNNFVVTGKAAGWWSKLKFVMPFCGDDHLAAQVPLITQWGSNPGSWFNPAWMTYTPSLGVHLGSFTGSGHINTGIMQSTWVPTGLHLVWDATLDPGTGAGYIFGGHHTNQFRLNVYTSTGGNSCNLQNNGNIPFTGTVGYLDFNVENYGGPSGEPRGQARVNNGSNQTMNQCWDAGPADPWTLYLLGSHASYSGLAGQTDPLQNTTVRFAAVGEYFDHNSALHGTLYNDYQTLRTALGR